MDELQAQLDADVAGLEAGDGPLSSLQVEVGRALLEGRGASRCLSLARPGGSKITPSARN